LVRGLRFPSVRFATWARKRFDHQTDHQTLAALASSAVNGTTSVRLTGTGSTTVATFRWISPALTPNVSGSLTPHVAVGGGLGRYVAYGVPWGPPVAESPPMAELRVAACALPMSTTSTR